mgnify:FL=1
MMKPTKYRESDKRKKNKDITIKCWLDILTSWLWAMSNLLMCVWNAAFILLAKIFWIDMIRKSLKNRSSIAIYDVCSSRDLYHWWSSILLALVPRLRVGLRCGTKLTTLRHNFDWFRCWVIQLYMYLSVNKNLTGRVPSTSYSYYLVHKHVFRKIHMGI